MFGSVIRQRLPENIFSARTHNIMPKRVDHVVSICQCASHLGTWKQGTHIRGERPWPADDSQAYTYDNKTMYVYDNVYAYDLGGKTVSEARV